MTVIELARLAEVTPDVIRYYARIGLLKPSRNAVNNYMQFCREDVKCVRFIRRAQRLGFSLAEIVDIIETSRNGGSPCRMVRETLGRRIEENGRALAELVAVQNRMEHTLAQWQQMLDGSPGEQALCSLIEAMEET
ncbi:MAG TPA: MerR family transcriptional regulator [Novimethylophilus sp.]|jgi:DNA-binding transcriptional MerR regulator|uniref:MerR family transcriptional regulator n=1 Tax=Novimethylophilus sp. TaxID=2137426 RepID=UPI002F406296